MRIVWIRAAPAAAGALLDALLLVDHLAREAQGARRALVDLLQRHLERVHHVLALLDAVPAAAPSAAPAEHVEDVRRPAAAIAALDGLLAALVVELALALVAEHVEGLLDLLEEVLVAALVRVVLDRQLAVRLLDHVRRRVLLHAEHLVVLRVVHRATPAARAATRHAAAEGVLKAGRETTEEHGAKL